METDTTSQSTPIGMELNDRPSDQEIYDRILDLTMSGTLDWKQVYTEEGGPEPKEDLARSTAPNGYYAEDPYHGFGRIAVKPEDEEDEVLHPVLYVSGERLSVSGSEVDTLIDAIEQYVDEVRTGANPSTAERINREIERNLDPMREQLASMEQRVARREEEVGSLITCLQNATAGDAPPLTTENVLRVLKNLEYEVDEQETIHVKPESVETAIEDTELALG